MSTIQTYAAVIGLVGGLYFGYAFVKWLLIGAVIFGVYIALQIMLED